MSHISGMIRAMSAVPRVHLADPQANVRRKSSSCCVRQTRKTSGSACFRSFACAATRAPIC